MVPYTRTWNPAKEDQAPDRTWRIGQTKDAYAYYAMVAAEDFTTFDVKLGCCSRKNVFGGRNAERFARIPYIETNSTSGTSHTSL